MPLPSAAPRRRLHERTVRYEGFARDDGLFDIDAQLVDVKDHAHALLSGPRAAGEPVHAMGVRLTIDRAFTVHAVDPSGNRSANPPRRSWGRAASRAPAIRMANGRLPHEATMSRAASGEGASLTSVSRVR